MKFICNFSSVWKKILASSLLSLSALSACSRTESTDVPVSIHAVNYSDQEFEYSVRDPANQSNVGGGESIGRYAAGGTMCCYTLPKTWRPGMKVEIHYELYFPAQPGENIRTSIESSVIDIPQYVTPQELWVVRDAQGTMSVILSNFQPDHPSWPGNVKGWPIPSLAFQRERADIYIHMSEGLIDALQELSDGMKDAPDKTAKGMWEQNEQYDRKANIGYNGYQDKKYQKFLTDDFHDSLIEEKENLKKLKAARP